jgi:hypothetical protein
VRRIGRRKIEAGSSAAVEGVYLGTHTGAAPDAGRQRDPGHGPSRQRAVRVMFDVEGAQIASHHAYWDVAGFMAQLGLSGNG